jgi:hypothetical protein
MEIEKNTHKFFDLFKAGGELNVYWPYSQFGPCPNGRKGRFSPNTENSIEKALFNVVM